MTNSANTSPIFATPTVTVPEGMTPEQLRHHANADYLHAARTGSEDLRAHLINRANAYRHAADSMSTHLAQPSELRARYRLGGPGTTVLHLSARDFTDLGLDPHARTIHLFGATFTRLETI
jgi:hypothetical protein